MKRARARERAHVIDILPYTVIFFVWASNTTRAGWLLSQSVMRWYQHAHFYVYVTIYVGMNKTAPRDASTISTTSIQPFMMYKTQSPAGSRGDGLEKEAPDNQYPNGNL